MPLSQLAEEQVFERTSLYRALKPRRAELVKLIAEDGRWVREAALTARGRQRIATALRHWQEAQDEFLARFGNSA